MLELAFIKKKKKIARAGRDSLKITHFQYADDTLIFCDAEEKHLKNIETGLGNFLKECQVYMLTGGKASYTQLME